MLQTIGDGQVAAPVEDSPPAAVVHELEYVLNASCFRHEDPGELDDEQERWLLDVVTGASLRDNELENHGRLVRVLVEGDAKGETRADVVDLAERLCNLADWIDSADRLGVEGSRSAYTSELGERLGTQRCAARDVLNVAPLRRSAREKLAIALMCRSIPDPTSDDRRVLPAQATTAMRDAAEALRREVVD
ncbi:MAG: hypothetical protein ABII12_06580, partial [Planctomycetota bacterium]